MTENIILRVKNLNVKLDGEKVLKNLSFKVRKGETLTILGPNGAGKTVLLKTLLGLLPYHGEIKWRKGVRIGYVPQRLPFIKDVPMDVEEFFRLKGVSKSMVAKILNSVGIKREVLKHKIGKLSSGQFQRILVGWSLSSNPHVLLFDEPFAGIDISGQESIYDLLKKFKERRELTILLVSHELSVVYKLTSKVLCLNKKLLYQGPPKEVLTPKRLAELYGGKIKFHQHK